MSEPLPHYVNIAAKLKSLGVDGYDEPMIFILGGKVVTAEINARHALRRLATAIDRITSDTGDLDGLDAQALADAADAVGAYQSARSELLTTAERLGLRLQVAAG